MKVARRDSGDTCSRHVHYFPRTGRVRVRHLSPRTHRQLGAHEQRYLDRLRAGRRSAGEIDLF